MDLALLGKNALVTGASYGIGYSCAKSLAEEGVNVAICSRNADKVRASAEEIASISAGKVVDFTADLTNENDLMRLVQESKESLGNIDILVVSTGHPPTHPFSIATDEHWKHGTDLVLRPAILLTRLVLDEMRARKFGRIIFIGSIFGLEPEMTSVVQSTLRTGLNAMAKCIATEVAADGVTVNVICPGYFDTPLVRELAKQYATSQNVSVEKVLTDWASYAPVKRFGKPDDLGSLVAFLASTKAEFITGTTITIDGGAVRRY
ncbi:SDR family oxidoreductase [bacterium]|nr:SDR family oxidoreductase [bacterium]QQR56682.1 MAG: SDR family oxidoreductase [Candidatus Melainabacteria bacterium]